MNYNLAYLFIIFILFYNFILSYSFKTVPAFSLSCNTGPGFITPKRDKGWTYEISFRGLLNQKSYFLQKSGVTFTMSDNAENHI